MRKRLLAALIAGLFALGGGTALAGGGPYGAFPDNAGGDSDRCQELGDDRDGGNSTTGLEIADEAAGSVIELIEDEDCDNSGGRRQ